jgi:hypothetical protein
MGRRIWQHSTFVQQLSDGIHPLAPSPGRSPLTTSATPFRVLWLAGLVYERGIETADAGGDDLAIVPACLDHAPAARCDAEVDAKGTLTPPNRGSSSVHNRKIIVD